MSIKSISLLFLLVSFSVSASTQPELENKANIVDKSGTVLVEQSKPAKQQSTKATKDKSDELLKEKWGVGEFIVRLSSAGYMLDVRYRVTDKVKAKPLFSRKLRPFVIAEASGVRYGVPSSPKIGFIRQAPSVVKEDKSYFMFIANPGKVIEKGDKVTLVIGDFRVEHLTVE